jgi:hypothetical protein
MRGKGICAIVLGALMGLAGEGEFFACSAEAGLRVRPQARTRDRQSTSATAARYCFIACR